MNMVYEQAGYIGLDPEPYTIREIWDMAMGKRKEAWSHTSSVLSIIQNVNCDKKGDRRAPAFFNPTIPNAEKTKRPDDIRSTKLGMDALKSMMKQFNKKHEKGDQ